MKESHSIEEFCSLEKPRSQEVSLAVFSKLWNWFSLQGGRSSRSLKQIYVRHKRGIAQKSQEPSFIDNVSVQQETGCTVSLCYPENSRKVSSSNYMALHVQDTSELLRPLDKSGNSFIGPDATRTHRITAGALRCAY